MAENQPPQPPGTPPVSGLSKHPGEDMLEVGESIVTTVHRSIIGLLGIYLVAFLAIAAILALIISISPGFFKTSSSNISSQLMGIIILAAVLLVLILYSATYIYRQSELLITTKSLMQITQKSLFMRKVSRLSLSDVEDVSVEQRGILSALFGYGTLTVQTAGERENFIFPLCPSPQRYADQIIEARQAFIDDDQHTP
jgi:membrane protein YdbS with pleckstrin-like domain